VAKSQETNSHPQSLAVCLLWVVVTLALHVQGHTKTATEASPKETTQLVPACLGVSAAATSYTTAATDSGGSVTERREKVSVGQDEEFKHKRYSSHRRCYRNYF
jgi:hypothetical protein